MFRFNLTSASDGDDDAGCASDGDRNRVESRMAARASDDGGDSNASAMTSDDDGNAPARYSILRQAFAGR